MALQQDMTLKAYGQEITIPTVYIKVNEIKGDKEKCMATVVFLTADGVQKIKQEQYQFSSDTSNTSGNFIKQAYEHLKTLPEFEGASDV